MWSGRDIHRRVVLALVLVVFWAGPSGEPVAYAGGAAERILVIIDPDDPDSMHIGNYYIHARQVHPNNVIYLPLQADDYFDFVHFQINALLGELKHRKLFDRIDVIVTASNSVFRIPAEGLLTETESTCAPNQKKIDNLSLTTALALAPMANQILAGDAAQPFGLTSDTRSGYSSTSGLPIAFSAAKPWKDGAPGDAPDAQRFFLASMLGFTGERGNTVDEIKTMIDRSVLADGSNPPGTFYLMETTDVNRSSKRDIFFDATTNAIQALGGDAVHGFGTVPPPGTNDALGVMTGTSAWMAQPSDLSFIPGAFADHMTSWAASFNQPTHTKVAAWIALGASGSHGTVEEPCVVGEKFPHPQVHLYYFQGLSLGEAVYRSLRYLPFETLIYGDPLTQPFATIPTVSPPALPHQPISGAFVLAPVSSTSKPGAAILRNELYIDGAFVMSRPPGNTFVIDTALLADGYHEIRILSVDNSPVATIGRWIGEFESRNVNRELTLTVDPPVGDLATSFELKTVVKGGPVSEVLIRHNGRVVASSKNGADANFVSGIILGAGPVTLQAEARFTNGTRARSAPVQIEIQAEGGACCLPDGSCRVHTQAVCDQVAGVFSSNGVACASVSCPTEGTGDFDMSGSVDMVDAADFMGCFSGKDVIIPTNGGIDQARCLESFDFDEDFDVDLADLEVFSQLIRGPLSPGLGLSAYSYDRVISSIEPTLINLPATDATGEPLSYMVTQAPNQAVVSGSGSQISLAPLLTANGQDSLEFSVMNAMGVSTTGVVSIAYAFTPPSEVTVSLSALGEPQAKVTFSPPDKDGRSEAMLPAMLTFDAGGLLQLDAENPFGVSIVGRWVVSGEMMPDGMSSISVPLDQNVTAVVSYIPRRVLTVKASLFNPQIFVSPDPLGINIVTPPFNRTYLLEDGLVMFPFGSVPPPSSFMRWRLDGVNQAIGTNSLTVNNMQQNRQAIALYNNVPADIDQDADVDLFDVAEFGLCFSGDISQPGFVPPSPECLAKFDLPPADGDVDEADFAQMMGRLTGPF